MRMKEKMVPMGEIVGSEGSEGSEDRVGVRGLVEAGFWGTDVMRDLWDRKRGSVGVPFGFWEIGKDQPNGRLALRERVKWMEGFLGAGRLAALVGGANEAEVRQYEDDARVSLGRELFKGLGNGNNNVEGVREAFARLVGDEEAKSLMLAGGIEDWLNRKVVERDLINFVKYEGVVDLERVWRKFVNEFNPRKDKALKKMLGDEVRFSGLSEWAKEGLAMAVKRKFDRVGGVDKVVAADKRFTEVANMMGDMIEAIPAGGIAVVFGWLGWMGVSGFLRQPEVVMRAPAIQQVSFGESMLMVLVLNGMGSWYMVDRLKKAGESLKKLVLE